MEAKAQLSRGQDGVCRATVTKLLLCTGDMGLFSQYMEGELHRRNCLSQYLLLNLLYRRSLTFGIVFRVL